MIAMVSNPLGTIGEGIIEGQFAIPARVRNLAFGVNPGA